MKETKNSNSGNEMYNYETAKNIRAMIEATNDTYNFIDHVFSFGKGSFNCNTALQKTMVGNSNKNK